MENTNDALLFSHDDYFEFLFMAISPIIHQDHEHDNGDDDNDSNDDDDDDNDDDGEEY